MYENFGAVNSKHTVVFKLSFPDIAIGLSQYSNGALLRIKHILVKYQYSA